MIDEITYSHVAVTATFHQHPDMKSFCYSYLKENNEIPKSWDFCIRIAGIMSDSLIQSPIDPEILPVFVDDYVDYIICQATTPSNYDFPLQPNGLLVLTNKFFKHCIGQARESSQKNHISKASK